MSYKSKYTGKQIEDMLSSAKSAYDNINLMGKTGMMQTIINLDVHTGGVPFTSFEDAVKTASNIYSDLIDKGLLNPTFPFMIMFSIGEKVYDGSELKLFRYIPDLGKPEDPDSYVEFNAGQSMPAADGIFSINENFLLLVPDNQLDQTIKLINFPTGSTILPGQYMDLISMKHIDEYMIQGGPDLSSDFNEIFSWFRNDNQPPNEIEMTIEMQLNDKTFRRKVKLSMHGVSFGYEDAPACMVHYKTPIIQNPASGAETEAIVSFLLDLSNDDIGIFIGNQLPMERLPSPV